MSDNNQTVDYYIAPKESFDATADAIRAVTGESGEIEWKSNGFADALENISNVDLSWVESQTPTPSVRNFFYALAHGMVEHGEFTLTNLTTDFQTIFTMNNFGSDNPPQGIIIIDKNFYQGTTDVTHASTEAAHFLWMDKSFINSASEDVSATKYLAFRAMENTTATTRTSLAEVFFIIFDGTTTSMRAYYQWNGNEVQIKNSYSNNLQYCLFAKNHTYIWMAY